MIGELLELRKLLKNGKLSSVALNRLQEEKLRTVIQHAYENVPYYRALFASAGLAPEDIRVVDDLKYVPITTKDDLRAAGVGRVTAKGLDLASCRVLTTTGSTGKPFNVYLSRDEARTRRLVEFRALLSVGFRPRDRLSVLGVTRPHRLRSHQRLGFYRSENISDLLSIEDQIVRLRRMRPTVLWAYPTVLRALLHRVGYRLSRIVRPRALITSAEVFDDGLRSRILADMGIEMFNFYGATEVGRIASECPAHEGLHVNVDHAILECLGGERPTGWGKPGVAVVTALNAFAMPFIRYNLGDICTPIEKTCSCGSSFPLIHAPLGREDDMIRLPSGKILSPLPLIPIVREVSGIDQYRCIQESPEHLVLQLVLQLTLTEEKLARIRSQLMAYLGEPVRLDIQIVDVIQDDAQKFKTFISKLPQSDL